MIMKILKWLDKFIRAINRPPAGSTYTYFNPGSAYHGFKGTVHHDPDGGFSITDGKSWLVITN